MGESNGDWGQLAEADSELAEAWDSFDRLPQAGASAILDTFCSRKHISIEALVRIGTRMSASDVLAFVYPGGLKFRNLVTGQRWNYTGSSFSGVKIITGLQGPSDTVIVCEGETDAARLTMVYPQADVAMLPAGARAFPDGWAKQLLPYRGVLLGLDDDEAGEAGARKIAKLVPHAVRFKPPAKDWCDTDEFPDLPDPEELPAPLNIVVTGGELLELEAPDVPSWFDNAILPIGGLAILHGWAKGYKTFQALDMMSALAQGNDWCLFDPTEEPCRVCVVQFEIPWPYYKQRCQLLYDAATHKDLWKENFTTYSPLARPHIRATDEKSQKTFRENLLVNSVQVVLFDPIRRATGAIDMNSEQEVRHMLGFFETLQDEGITVIATHHDNKEGAKAGGGDAVSMTGSGAWAGDPDTIISVAIPKGQTIDSPNRNLHFTLRNAPSPGVRGMTMEPSGHITYQTEPHGPEDEGGSLDAPAI